MYFVATQPLFNVMNSRKKQPLILKVKYFFGVERWIAKCKDKKCHFFNSNLNKIFIYRRKKLHIKGCASLSFVRLHSKKKKKTFKGCMPAQREPLDFISENRLAFVAKFENNHRGN
jgi:hypothetical protein